MICKLSAEHFEFSTCILYISYSNNCTIRLTYPLFPACTKYKPTPSLWTRARLSVTLRNAHINISTVPLLRQNTDTHADTQTNSRLASRWNGERRR